ncbi:MAG TPA: diacylglycerol kinase family protein [Bacteroidales bacterium]|nr:diacylglycerol kinase family protein [Bacteroidales bacterium]
MEEPGRKRVILFIINPISGIGKQKNIEELIRDNIDASSYEYQVKFTKGPGHGTELAKEAVASGVNVVVAIGGDGTVNEIGQALVGSSTALGIIPTGSGNGLARHLKIPFQFKKAIEVINHFKIRKIDTATINDQVFLSIAGVGYDAFVAKKFADAPKRGFFTYFRIVSNEYSQYRPRKYILEVDGRIIKRRALSITFANSNQFGNNTSIDPNAKLDDGLIDVCVVRRVPLWLVPLYVPALFFKTFHKTQYMEIIRAKKAVVTRKKGKTIHLDGDPSQTGKVLEMKVNPLSLNIIVP